MVLGVRGNGQPTSLPSRGAWIEISWIIIELMMIKSLPSRGAWIEIRIGGDLMKLRLSRSPRGERGLKSQFVQARLKLSSLPSRGAWIEISSMDMSQRAFLSLPSRGAWIEIMSGRKGWKSFMVAPLAGSVD